MTDILLKDDNEAVLLEHTDRWQEWLQQPANANPFATNQEMLDGEEPLMDDWEFFDPREITTEQIDEMRQDSAHADDWRIFVEECLPQCDPEIEYYTRYKMDAPKRKQESIERCGEIRENQDPSKPGKLVKEKWYCKRNGCPICDAKRKEMEFKKLRELFGYHVARVTPQQEQAVKAQCKNKEYKRIPDDRTGETYIVLTKKLDDCPVLEWTKLDNELIETMCDAIVASTRRISGKLGNRPAIVSSEEEIENAVQVEVRTYVIEYDEDSTISDDDELMTEVLKEFEFDCLEERNEELLQWTLYQLEEKTKQIAKRHCVKIHFRGKKVFTIDIEKVDWSLVDKQWKKPTIS